MKNLHECRVFGQRSTFLPRTYCLLYIAPSQKRCADAASNSKWNVTPWVFCCLSRCTKAYWPNNSVCNSTATKLFNAHSSSNRCPVTGCIQLNNATSDWQPAKPYKEPNSQDLMTKADIIIIISSSNYLANRRANALTFALCSANTDGCLWFPPLHPPFFS